MLCVHVSLLSYVIVCSSFRLDPIVISCFSSALKSPLDLLKPLQEPGRRPPGLIISVFPRSGALPGSPDRAVLSSHMESG